MAPVSPSPVLRPHPTGTPGAWRLPPTLVLVSLRPEQDRLELTRQVGSALLHLRRRHLHALSAGPHGPAFRWDTD